MATILNGQLPAALLATVPWDTAERLRPSALADLLRLNAAFRARFGHNLIINESYRDLARQKAYYKNPPSGVGTAAWPGTSNHGWGLALDLRLTAAEYAWMRTNAPRYGWVNPLWAHDGRGVEEPWHWEHATAESVIPDVIAPAPTPAPTPALLPEEDDMHEFIADLFLHGLGREGSPAEIARWNSYLAQLGITDRSAARMEFWQSPAEAGTVKVAFQEFLGRASSPDDDAKHVAAYGTIIAVRDAVWRSVDARRRRGEIA